MGDQQAACRTSTISVLCRRRVFCPSRAILWRNTPYAGLPSLHETEVHPLMTSANGPIAEFEDPAAKPTSRRFSPECKLRMVAENDAAPTEEKVAIARRERLCNSHIIDWRAARDAVAMTTLTDQRTNAARPKKAAEQSELE